MANEQLSAPPEEGPVPARLPVLPIVGAVVFPHVLVPLAVTDAPVARAVGTAASGDRRVVLVTVRPGRDPAEPPGDEPPFYTVGTLGLILQHVELPDASLRVLIQGRTRLRLSDFRREGGAWFATASEIPPAAEDEARIQALQRIVIGQFQEIVSLLPRGADEAKQLLGHIADAGQLADFIGAHLNLDVERKQRLLEEASVSGRLEQLTSILNEERRVLEYGTELQKKLKDDVEKTQKEFWLREQMRVIREELGEEGESDAEELRRRIEAAGMPDAVREQAERELRRLERTMQQLPDYHVIRTYLEWLVDMPWSAESREEIDLRRARRILDRDHYDLDDVKERIIEFLAVRKLNPGLHAPILCFVGPPGVGKTSLGRSIAEAIGRAFTRMSLGGIRDEVEIRGHRRTYVGALPGRIIRGIRNAGVRNPVFMLDEIDKVGQDFRGDPTSALLEVLDPAQNHTFSDHYLEVPFDLSRVMFIATANTLATVPPALQDRLETLELPGYASGEKIEIARRHQIPRQLEAAGLRPGDVEITEEALHRLIDEYTREAGVRDLERQIGRIMRRIALRRVESGESGAARAAGAAPATGRAEGVEGAEGVGERGADGAGGTAATGATGGEPAPPPAVRVTPENLEEFAGRRRFEKELAGRGDEVGTATALAYTPAGGQILFVEAVAVAGEGEIHLTGHLGDVMKESARAAYSYVRSEAARLGIAEDRFAGRDVHVHVPAGATPKDGPSAGVAMVVALASLFTGRPVRSDVAMTGEVTLRGHVLPVGGTKEKLIAAAQAGIATVLLPRRNAPDLEEVPDDVKDRLELVLVDDAAEAVARALGIERAGGEGRPWRAAS